MLEYDDSAFYYFCLALLSFYMVPGTYYFLVKQVWPAIVPPKDPQLEARTEVRTSVCKTQGEAHACRDARDGD